MIQKRPYPQPGPVGGKLIRQTIAFLKTNGLLLPLTDGKAAHILIIAVSGGSDSVALAHLLTHYGRKIASKEQIRLLHVNHGWRGKDSDQDAEFVRNLGREWGVPVIVRKAEPPKNTKSSWEEDAREKRKAIFKKEAEKLGARVLTAHQADDLAETLLWRLFTGAAATHGGGISCRVGIEVRPFLTTRKTELLKYLRECKQTYREDSTNTSPRFMRSRIRSSILPSIETVFPKAVDHLIAAALNAQRLNESEVDASLEQEQQALLQSTLFRAAGVKVRRSQWELILQKGVAKKDWSGEIHLPNGWKLKCELNSKPSVNLDALPVSGSQSGNSRSALAPQSHSSANPRRKPRQSGSKMGSKKDESMTQESSKKWTLERDF